MCYQQ
ncbi:hypothetical protein SKAU_G00090500 [Synaphobranchus kaupii]